MTTAKHNEIAALFDRFDEDGDGAIQRAELGRLLHTLDPNAWDDKSVDALVSALDTDQDGRVDCEDFLAWVFEAGNEHGSACEKLAGQPEKVVKTHSIPSDLPRWMIHDRGDKDYPRTSLRVRPSANKDFLPCSVINGEVVEVLETEGDYIKVQAALQRTEGWLHKRLLHPCKEGASEEERLAAVSDVRRIELKAHEGRLKDVRKYLRRRNRHRGGSDIRAEQVWFLQGYLLGEAALQDGRPKEVHFFGCSDDLAETIADRGFDAVFEEAACGKFGKGLHFSPLSCKAFGETENYMLICEVAPGKQDDRLTLRVPNDALDQEEVCGKQGMLSVQCHVCDRFDHEERVVYNPAQCKPVYLLKLEHQGYRNYSHLCVASCPRPEA